MSKDVVWPVARRSDDSGSEVVRYELSRGSRFYDTAVGEIPVPLPEKYVLGIDFERRDFENPPLPSYLRGTLRRGGWWYFYAYALAVKLPIGTIVLLVLTLCLAYGRRVAWAEGLCLLGAPAAVLLIASIESGVAQSVRYVLPALPPVFVAAGCLGRLFERERIVRGPAFSATASRARALRALVVGCLVGNGVSVMSVYPHFLSYFNEAAGGPSQGAKHLIFSNLDWGQDLLHLKRWIADHPEAHPLGLAYFHFVDPAVEGMEFQLPPREPKPGWYAVSVNLVHGMAFSADEWQRGGTYGYFKHLTPCAKAGYSIYIYHVTIDDANRLRRALGLAGLAAENGVDDQDEAVIP